MLEREHVAQLLMLQSKAYELLMWLAGEASRDPTLLSPKVVALLREPASAAQWLARERQRLPVGLMPVEPAGAVATLFASFFSTSFRVSHLEYDGRLMESRLNVGVRDEHRAAAGLEQCQALALRHLAASEKLPITDKDARTLVRRKALREASVIWTYAWELDRRAKQKGKGPVVHRIWRSIPAGTRRSLDVGRVWEARAQLLGAVREYCANEAP